MYYREMKNCVEIVTIFDTRQDPNKLDAILTGVV